MLPRQDPRAARRALDALAFARHGPPPRPSGPPPSTASPLTSSPCRAPPIPRAPRVAPESTVASTPTFGPLGTAPAPTVDPSRVSRVTPTDSQQSPTSPVPSGADTVEPAPQCPGDHGGSRYGSPVGCGARLRRRRRERSAAACGFCAHAVRACQGWHEAAAADAKVVEGLTNGASPQCQYLTAIWAQWWLPC